MVNVLIADDNIYYAKILMDSLNDIRNIKICNIALNGQEVIDILKKEDNNIDVILLDLIMPIYSGIDILDFLERKQVEKYKKSIIIVSGDMELMIKVRNNPFIYSYISKSSDFMKIYTIIKELAKLKEEEKQIKTMKERILKEIQYLGYDIRYKGTNYLKECIEFIQSIKKVSINNLKEEVYPVIAKRNNTTVHNVKCNINKATEQMYYDCDREILQRYFLFNDDTKPTVKTVINMICSKLEKDV